MHVTPYTHSCGQPTVDGGDAGRTRSNGSGNSGFHRPTNEKSRPTEFLGPQKMVGE